MEFRRVLFRSGAVELRLHTGHVWRQAVDDRTPEAAHDLRSNGGSNHTRICRAVAKARSLSGNDPAHSNRRIIVMDVRLGKEARPKSRTAIPAPAVCSNADIVYERSHPGIEAWLRRR